MSSIHRGTMLEPDLRQKGMMGSHFRPLQVTGGTSLPLGTQAHVRKKMSHQRHRTQRGKAICCPMAQLVHCLLALDRTACKCPLTPVTT